MTFAIRALCLGLIFSAGHFTEVALAQVTDSNNYPPPNYSTFQPPAVGGAYTDPVFGTAIQRITSAPTTPNLDGGGNLIFITDEYSSMSPFNLDNSKILVVYQSYFALYDGSGHYLKTLPFEINSSSEPRWSRSNSNLLYYRVGNQLKQYDASTDALSVVHTFSDYSTISGKGESDISFDGNHFVFAGDNRYVFVYELSTDSKGPALDTGGRGFDSLYITPNNNVTVTWLQSGTSRFTGIELFDRNMNFQRQLAHAGGHMDVTRDSNGDEVLVWTNSNDANPISGCGNGVVKVRLSDARQTCLLSLDWSLAVNISGPDNAGWALVATYAPSDPSPGSSNWVPYTNELFQVSLDGTEVRRLAHHRSRPFDSYNYTPRVSVSRDGSRFIYSSNYNLQAILGYNSIYSDVYLAALSGSTPLPEPTPTPVPEPTPTPTPTPDPTPTPTPDPTPTPTPSPSPSRTEQDDPAVAYGGGPWFPNSLAGHSGGGAVLAVDVGSQVTFTFTGTSVRWLGYRDEWSGIANVYLDGQFQTTVDTYASPSQFQAVLFTASGLTLNTHTLVLQVTGTRSSSSGGAWVWVDAFDVDATATTSASVPLAPTGLAATSPTRKQVRLTWNLSPGAISYRVKRSRTKGGPYATIASEVTSTNYLNTGLTSKRTYYYVVSAVNATGDSPSSVEASVTAR